MARAVPTSTCRSIAIASMLETQWRPNGAAVLKPVTLTIASSQIALLLIQLFSSVQATDVRAGERLQL